MKRVPSSVLFLCTGNSCRSQMAEGWLRHLAPLRFDARSAGVEAHGMNARAVAAMAEVGVDISGQRSELIEAHLVDPPDLIVTVCDHAASCCPDLPVGTLKEHWPFPDPAHARGTDEEIAAEFRAVRDAIRARIEAWLAGDMVSL